MDPRAPGWIHMKFEHLLIENHLKTGLKSSRLDSYENWTFVHWESVEDWPEELQVGFIWHLNILNWESTEEWPQELQVGFIRNLNNFYWESIEEWPHELQAGVIWNLNLFLLGSRMSWRMVSRAPGWIHMTFEHFSIKHQLKNGLKSSSPGWTHMKLDHFSISNQLKNGLKSSRLDSWNLNLF